MKNFYLLSCIFGLCFNFNSSASCVAESLVEHNIKCDEKNSPLLEEIKKIYTMYTPPSEGCKEQKFLLPVYDFSIYTIREFDNSTNSTNNLSKTKNIVPLKKS